MKNRVVSYLKNKNIKHRIGKYSGAKNAGEAASQIGLLVNQMIKSLVIKSGDTFVMALVPFNKQLNLKKVGDSAKLANRDEVYAVTGYMVGVVSPFMIKNKLEIVIDSSVLELKEIGVGSGEAGVEIIIKPIDLQNLTSGQVLDITLK